MWALLATAASRIVTLAGLSLLAHFLVPRDFGLLAFALVYIVYAQTVGDLGTGMALVYWPARREDAAQVTFVINLVMGAGWCVITLLLAPAIASFFRTPEGESIIRVLAFSFPIQFLGNTHDALARKDLRFRARLIPELSQATTKAVVSVVLALQGFGAWSLVWGQLAGQSLWTLMLWVVVPWRPRWSFPRDLFGPMLRYGRGIISLNIVSAIVHHADLAIVGRMLGATALGLYQIAYKIPEMTITVIIWVISTVLFPAFSRVQAATERLREAYLTAARYVSAITVPAAVGLFFLAEPLVIVLFGTAWRGSIPILQALAIYGGLRSLGTHAGDVLKATGRTHLLALLSVAKAVVMVPALILAARQSAVAVAGTLAGVTALTMMVNLVVVSRLIELRASELFASFRPSLIAGVVLTGGMAVWIRITGASPSVSLALGVPVGAILYLFTLHRIDPHLFFGAIEMIRRKRPAPIQLETATTRAETEDAGTI